MIHYLLLKFQPGGFTPEICQLAKTTYRELQNALEGIQEAEVCCNNALRDSDADLLIRLTLREREDLKTYLDHPLHLAFVRQVDERVVQRLTFDQF